jgi:hypothetical protein
VTLSVDRERSSHDLRHQRRGCGSRREDLAELLRGCGPLRDERDTTIEAARFLQQRNPAANVVVTDLRDGSNVAFDRSA